MTTIIVEQPDDVPVVGVSEHNPYKKEQERLHEVEPRAIYFGTTMYYIPANSIYHASELEQFSKTVKSVCVFDTVLVFINFLLIGYLPILITIIFNYIGYVGASRFNKILLGLYSIYQGLNFSSKIVLIIINPYPNIGIILGVSSIFNLIMIVMTVKFIRMIPF